MKRKMIESCDQAIALFDSTKASHFAFIPFANLAEVHVSITDSGLPASLADAMKAAGRRSSSWTQIGQAFRERGSPPRASARRECRQARLLTNRPCMKALVVPIQGHVGGVPVLEPGPGSCSSK